MSICTICIKQINKSGELADEFSLRPITFVNLYEIKL